MPQKISSEIRNLIKKAKILDSLGKFKESDNIFVKLSQYYVEQSVTKVPSVQYFEMDAS